MDGRAEEAGWDAGAVWRRSAAAEGFSGVISRERNSGFWTGAVGAVVGNWKLSGDVRRWIAVFDVARQKSHAAIFADAELFRSELAKGRHAAAEAEGV